MRDAALPWQPFTIERLESRQLLTATALDLNFGVQGRVVSDFRVDGISSSDFFGDAILQDDGKLLVLVAGEEKTIRRIPFLVRYNPDGSRDESFGPRGQLALPREGNGYYKRIHVLPDGKLLLAGQYSYYIGSITYTRLMLARLNADFSVDSSFGVGGVVTSESAITNWNSFDTAILPDGKILAGGQNSNGWDPAAIWRFNSDGTLDTTFGTNGVVRYNYGTYDQRIGSLLVNPDGSFFASTPRGEAKFNPDGSVDASFGNSGYLAPDIVWKLRQPDGRFLAFQRLQVSQPGNKVDIVVSRWNPDGTPDLGFGSNGARQIDFGETDNPNTMSVDSSGRIIVAAGAQNVNVKPESYQRFALARLLPDGTLDMSFGIGGKLIDQFGTAPLVVLPTTDDRIYVLGKGDDHSTEDPTLGNNWSNIAITRYVPDAPISFSIASSGPVIEADMFSVTDAGSSYANGQIVRYEWDNAYDGWYFNTEAQTPTAWFRAGDSPSTPVALRVTTSDGLQALAVIQVPVINVPPIANAGPDRRVAVGVPVQLQLRFDDVVRESGKLIVDYGDGSPLEVLSFPSPWNPWDSLTIPVTHSYATRGTYTLTLTADDGDGGIGTDTATIRVGNIVVNVFQDPFGEAYQPSFVPFPDQLVFIDRNDNGITDANEPSSVTDGNGDALFDELAPGIYKVRMQVPVGWQFSTPASLLTTDYCTVTITAAVGANCSFGLTQKVVITGVVFNDLNGNGSRDAGEPGVSGVRMWAGDSSSVLSGNDGSYRLSGVSPGGVYVNLTLPNGWIQTFPSGLTWQIVSSAPGQTIGHVDFGLRQIAAATVSGMVFSDTNGDGVRQLTEQGYAPQDFWYQFPIWLDANNDGVIDSNERRITLGYNGGWSLSGLPAGTYTFRLMPRPLFVQTWPADNAGITVTLADGQTATNLNFGFQKLDTVPPQLLNITFRYDLKPNEIEMFFSEPMEATTSPLKVMLNGKEVAWDGFWWDYGVYDKIRLIPRGGLVADGNYQVSLIPHVLFDKADNELPPMPNWSFFSLKGDINRDRQVTIDDFITLSSNFGKTSATYVDGDLNLDGIVTISDFIDLSSNFNASLAPLTAPQAPAAESVSPTSVTTDLLQQNDRETKNHRSPSFDWRKPHRLHHRRHRSFHRR
jgi:uncharacterized delta-60 repeat protein